MHLTTATRRISDADLIAAVNPKRIVSDAPVLALPPGRAARLLGLRRAIEAARHHDEPVLALPQGHTMPSGHPIFAAWLRCQAARSGC